MTYRTLKEIAHKIGSGATPRGGRESYKESGISLIRSQNILDFEFDYNGLVFIDEEQAQKLKNVIVEENDILLNITGDSVARCSIVPSQVLPARVNQHVMIIRVDQKKANHKYVFYYLQYLKRHLLQLASGGATRNALTKTMIENLEINLIPLEKQKEIANILSSLDDKIENNNAIIANLEEQAQAVLKNILNDYNFIQVKLKQLIDIYSGFAFKSKNYTPDGKHKIITIKNIEDGKINESSINKIDKIPDNIKEEAFLEIGDIVFSMTGNVGRTALVYKKGLLLNQRVGKVLLDNPDYISFFYFLFRSSSFKQRLINLAHGTAQSNLGKIDTLNLEIPYNEKAMADFSDIFNPVVRKIINLMNQNDKLVVIRDTLLPKLMSGEIRVEEAIEVE